MTGMGGFPPTNSGGNKVFVAATRICLSQKVRFSYWPLKAQLDRTRLSEVNLLTEPMSAD